MAKVPRLCKRKLPRYAHFPGRTPHPEREESGHSYGVEIKVSDVKIDFLYACDLFNLGYYWESHVWWEALWNHYQRKGEKADFLKALIKLAAAHLKALMQEAEVANTHLQRFHELLSPLKNKQFFRVDINSLVEKFNNEKSFPDAMQMRPQFKIEILN